MPTFFPKIYTNITFDFFLYNKQILLSKRRNMKTKNYFGIHLQKKYLVVTVLNGSQM